MKLTKYISAVLAVAALTGCTTMDQFPEDSMSPETFFSSETELEQFTNAFYSLMPAATNKLLFYDEHGELVSKNLPEDEILGSRSLPTKSSDVGWTWTMLRDINYFLQYSHRCQDKEVREYYEGVAYFFRALFYYNMLTKFGEVPVYLEPVGSGDYANLNKPRDSRETVINRILADCDMAYNGMLPRGKHTTRVCAYTAMALKSRAALFEGTFRKYHDGDAFNPGHLPWENLLQISADAAKLVMDKGGYSISTTGTEPYREMFYAEKANDKEYIWARIGSTSVGKLHNANDQLMTRGVSANKRLACYYLNADGTRFTDRADWKTVGYLDEFTGRDPRMSQTLLAPGYKQKGSSSVSTINFTSTHGCYQVIKYVAESSQNSYDKSRAAMPIFRIAEMYLNYAEALAELGKLTQNDLNISVNKIRARVKMPNLDMATANANPDPFMMSGEWGYPNVTKSENTGVILEIRRERIIEMFMECTHYTDILRWKEGKTYEKPYYGIYFPSIGTFDLSGNGKADICIWEGKKPTTTGVKYFQLNKDIFLSEGDHGFAVRCSEPGLQRSWDEGKDYLYGIPTMQRSLTNGALTQNPGWNDGLTF